jgi:tuftelin-interacting protein 11
VPLYAAWAGALLAFVGDNIINQLMLPRVAGTLADRRPLMGAPLLGARSCGPRMSAALLHAHRKVRPVLCMWHAEQPVPVDLGSWC